MDGQLKNRIKKVAEFISYSVSCTVLMVSSIFRMLVLSSFKVACISRKYVNLKSSDTCCVLGNGPSLKEVLQNNEVLLDNNDIFAVNMFCVSDYFTRIRPRFYFLVDGGFFAPTSERMEKQIDLLSEQLNNVSWQMYLVISSSSVTGGVLQKLNNPNINVIRLNSTTVDGFKGFRHMMYRIRLGMPRCQTVVNFALSAAIMMHYKTILLYGADHTWTRDLFVDDDNVVCYGDKHVYNTSLSIIKHTRSMAEILSDFSKMFATHIQIRQYADAENVKIINMTKGSFVDAYERK